MAKLNVTLPDEQLAEVRALVASGAAVSVSAFVRHAVRVAVADVAEWREMMRAALAETGGPLTDAERAWADSLLRPVKRRRRNH